MGVDPTLPSPGAEGSGHFPPPADPWSMETPGQPVPPVVPAQPYPMDGPPASGPPAPEPALPGPIVAQTGPGPVIAQIGEIAVTSSTVHTPTGDLPLAGSTWHVADYWQSEQKTPTWAIIAAIVGFCVLTVFSLFFLLVKETVQVTVTNGARQYVARIPVRSQVQVQQIHQQVNYVRSLAAL